MSPDELDGTDKLITLPHPMHFVIRSLLVFVAAAFVFPESVAASIVFKPGKKPEYVAARRGGNKWERSGTVPNRANC